MTVPEPQDRLTVEQVAALTGKAPKSVRRWMRDGVTVGGRVVRLASVKVGGCRLTSRGWLEAFVAAQNPGGSGAPVASPAARARDLSETRRRLAAVLRG